MRLTQFSDYTLRVLIYLALRGDRLATIKEIAESYDISRNHLMKVVNHLTQLGYVEAVRGQNGGLRMKVAPEDINLGALIRETEEDFIMAECFRPDNQCVITATCQLKLVLNDALNAFMDVLDDYQLSDLLTKNRATQRLLNIVNVSK